VYSYGGDDEEAKERRIPRCLLDDDNKGAFLKGRRGAPEVDKRCNRGVVAIIAGRWRLA
jgi:hypothetical protein